MADDSRSPVAIRIVRPYATEEEFLSHELESLARTTVTLVGAQSKPQGVILRFEILLATGDPLVRGEGRVVAYRAATSTAESRLTLRFTRLDARSKALVDRAAGMRDARSRGTSIPPPPPLPPLPPPPPQEPTAAPTKAEKRKGTTGGSNAPRRRPEPAPEPRAKPRPTPAKPSHGSPSAGARELRELRELPQLAAADRNRLLTRLRERAAALAPDVATAVLERGRTARR